MENLEKPLTWGLTILLLGYLFISNCECDEETTCTLNNEFNIGHESNIKSEEDISAEIEITNENIDLDSVLGTVPAEIKIDTAAETIEK